jgi:hypothetical protein
MKVILKEGEFDKLPRPEDFGYQNILEYHSIPKDTVFDVYRSAGYTGNNEFVILEYHGITIEMNADRFITIEELRDEKLNQLI